MSRENRLPDPRPATSLYDLLQHLTRMTTSLERGWSEGLETESARSARAEAKQVWQSFKVTFKRWTEYAFSLREQAGLEPVIIEEFPVQDTGLGRLSLDPDTSERRYYQLQIAAMYAFQDLMEILQALDDPNAWELRLPTGSVETWWEAGAFSLIRRRARSLARILKLSDEALQAMLRESSAEADVIGSYSQPSLWEDPLTSAFDLVNAGNYDAALPQLLAALRATLAELLSAAADDLPVPLAPSIADIDVLSSVSQHVPLLEAACERLGKGLLLDPGVAVPLARELLPRIQELAVNPPTAEQLAPNGQIERGSQEYTDHGPATPVHVKSTEILAVVCEGNNRATVWGTATVTSDSVQYALGTFPFRVSVMDSGEPSTADTYDILVGNGYYSGEDRPLQGGNIQIHRSG